jgi:hypothetical protein
MQKKTKQEKERITVSSLKQLKQMATSKKLRDILKNYIEHEKIPSVRAAWVEYFFDIKNKKLVNEK